MGLRRSAAITVVCMLLGCGVRKAGFEGEPDASEGLPHGCLLSDECPLGESCVDGACVLPEGEDAGTGKPPCTRDEDCLALEQCVKSTGECIPEKYEDAGPVDAGPPPACFDGQEVSCGSSKLGECRLGLSRCGADAGVWGFGACEGSVEPVPEACDGKDNDCDGMADDGLPAVSCGVGACAVSRSSCVNGVTEACVPGTPVAETCDGLDNDCNGAVDDGLVDLACGVGACARTQSACLNGQPRTCTPGSPAAETCNGLDDDCNGAVDDGLGSSTCGVGTCTVTMANCAAGAVQVCTPALSGRELCNGLDDDCNGAVDDALGDTTCGVGACSRTVAACVGGSSQACLPGAPAGETCNGFDDDCDGAVDNALGSTSCGVGACARTVLNCSAGVPQSCQAGAPVAELCNAVDDDCDGQIDEALGPISCGLGLCQRTIPSCQAGVPQVCTAWPPQAEICDGQDNDCDGTADEGCNCLDGQVRSCYTGPSGTAGIGACSAGSQACAGGNWNACSGQVLPAAELCNGLDDNCDGASDEDLGYTTCGTGVCQRTVANCQGGVAQVCAPFAPGAETCNGLDDDCNGTVDEGLGSTTCGSGACVRSVQNCIGGVAQVCTPQTPAAETCNGVDDDCDSQVDEDLGQASCGVGSCARTVQSCVGGSPQTCTAGTPGAEACNGLDDDCDGQLDNGLGNLSCGAGACARTVAACVGATPQTCTPGSPSAETCNGLDDDCDGPVDEGVCAPVVTCGANQTVNANSTVTLTSSASSPVGRPLTCQWTVVTRPATSSGTFGNASSCTGTTYFADVVGVHSLRFTTTDSLGLTASCAVDITVNALGDLWVELTWDKANDMDLHLRHPSAASNTHNAAGWGSAVSPYDCNWLNKTPSWDNPGTADDPSLDRDDITGTGPENTRINVASSSHDYVVGVHMYSYSASSKVTATVKVYCNNVLMTTRTRAFNTAKDFWVVGAVRFTSGGACNFTFDGYSFSLP